MLLEDDGQSYLAEPETDAEEARTLRPLQAGAVTYRIAFGPRAGRKVLTLRGAMPREAAARQRLCADIDGFSLHAAVRVEAHDRKRLERLCRYITRPALSEERIRVNAAGQVQLELKTPWRDGTTHLVLSPLEFMQRLAALVPGPRLHLIRYHGVLAPNARLRTRVVEVRAIRGARHGLAHKRCSRGGGCASAAFTPGCVRKAAYASCSPCAWRLLPLPATPCRAL